MKLNLQKINSLHNSESNTNQEKLLEITFQFFKKIFLSKSDLNKPEETTFEKLTNFMVLKSSKILIKKEIELFFPVIIDFLITVVVTYDYFTENIIDVLIEYCEKIKQKTETDIDYYGALEMENKSELNNNFYLLYNSTSKLENSNLYSE